MSKEWYLLNQPYLYTNGYENEDFTYYGDKAFNELLETFLAKDIYKYDSKIWEPPVQERMIIQNVTSDSINTSDIRQVLCKIGSLKCGAYLEFDGQYWIVASLPSNNGFYEKAILMYCNDFLNTISKNTGEIIKYPIPSENATKYNIGIKYETQVTIGSTQKTVFLPCDNETIEFNRNQRFLFGKDSRINAYSISQLDPCSYKCENGGLLQLTLVEDQFSPERDNAELLIADYYENINDGGWWNATR